MIPNVFQHQYFDLYKSVKLLINSPLLKTGMIFAEF